MQDMTLLQALTIFELKNKYTADELKKRYRELMKQYHPDRYEREKQEIKEQMKKKSQEINEAYEILKKNLTNPQQYTYTHETASTYWSNQGYQSYGYYRQTDAQLIYEMKEVKKKISSYFKPCPAEKLKDQVSNLILDYIVKVGRSQNPNLTFINFKIDLEILYINYIDVYAKKHKIPSFIIKKKNFNYDCDCSKLFNQIKDCESKIEYDLSKITRKFQYHDHFKILKNKIINEQDIIREKIDYYIISEEYIKLLKEYENTINKIIFEYNKKYNEFKYALDKLSKQLDKKIKKYLYDNIKEIVLKSTDEELTNLLIEAIKESNIKKELENIDQIRLSYSQNINDNQEKQTTRIKNTRETIYKELKKKFLNSKPNTDIVNKLFIKAATLLYSKNCTLKIVQEINNLTFNNPQEEYEKLSMYDSIEHNQTEDIKEKSSYRH